MTRDQLAWLAGILEGEGSFIWQKCRRRRGYPRISIEMTDREIIDKVAGIWERNVHARNRKNPKPGHNRSWITAVTGRPAEMWMARLKPYLGTRRRAQIERVLGLNKEQFTGE